MISVEYFRGEDQRPLDAEGYEVPEWENPFFLIPDQYDPTPEDITWLNENPSLPPISGGSPDDGPNDQDWDEYHAWSEAQDRLEGIYGLNQITDQDIAVAVGAVG